MGQSKIQKSISNPLFLHFHMPKVENHLSKKKLSFVLSSSTFVVQNVHYVSSPTFFLKIMEEQIKCLTCAKKSCLFSSYTKLSSEWMTFLQTSTRLYISVISSWIKGFSFFEEAFKKEAKNLLKVCLWKLWWEIKGVFSTLCTQLCFNYVFWSSFQILSTASIKRTKWKTPFHKACKEGQFDIVKLQASIWMCNMLLEWLNRYKCEVIRYSRL